MFLGSDSESKRLNRAFNRLIGLWGKKRKKVSSDLVKKEDLNVYPGFELGLQRAKS